MLKQKIILGVLCLSLSGCATLTRGTHEVVSINSEPVGAKAISDVQSNSQKNTLNGYILGVSPHRASLTFHENPRLL